MHLSRPSSDTRAKASPEEENQKVGSRFSVDSKISNPSSEDDDDDDDDESDDDEGAAQLSDSDGNHDGEQSEGFLRIRREKRLAMNRASARSRRKRKKVLLDSLANQVTEVTKKNHTLQMNNETLRARVEQLESALVQAQGTIQSLVADTAARSSAARQQQQQQPKFLGGAQLGGAGAGISGLSTANQETIRSLLLAAAPSLNTQAVVETSTPTLGDQLLAAHTAQLLGQQQQQNQHAQLLEAARQRIGYQPDLLSALSSPSIAALLGQARLPQVQHQPQLQAQLAQLVQAQGLGNSQGSGSSAGGVKRSQPTTSANSAIADSLKKARR